MTEGIPVSGSGSSVKVTLVVEKRRRSKVTLVEEERTLVALVALVVEERRRSRRDCISLGKRELDPHRGVLPISFHIKLGLALNVH